MAPLLATLLRLLVALLLPGHAAAASAGGGPTRQAAQQEEPERVYIDATAAFDVYHCLSQRDADKNELLRHCPEVWATLEDGRGESSGRRLRVRVRDPEDERWSSHDDLPVRGIPIHGWIDANGDVRDVGPARCLSQKEVGQVEEATEGTEEDAATVSGQAGVKRLEVSVTAGGEAKAAARRLCRVGSGPLRWFEGGEADAMQEGLDMYRAAVSTAEEARDEEEAAEAAEAAEESRTKAAGGSRSLGTTPTADNNEGGDGDGNRSAKSQRRRLTKS